MLALESTFCERERGEEGCEPYEAQKFFSNVRSHSIDKDDSLSMEESKLRILELRHLEITLFLKIRSL